MLEDDLLQVSRRSQVALQPVAKIKEILGVVGVRAVERGHDGVERRRGRAAPAGQRVGKEEAIEVPQLRGTAQAERGQRVLDRAHVGLVAEALVAAERDPRAPAGEGAHQRVLVRVIRGEIGEAVEQVVGLEEASAVVADLAIEAAVHAPEPPRHRGGHLDVGAGAALGRSQLTVQIFSPRVRAAPWASAAMIRESTPPLRKTTVAGSAA